MRQVLIAVGVVACSDSGFPEPPDIRSFEQAYATPTATVNDPTALGTLANAVLAIDQVLGRGAVVLDGSAGVVRDPAEAPEDRPAEPLPYDLEGRGVARITHVCPGWAVHEARRADLTGTLDLAVRFELGELIPVMWGTAEACAFEVADHRVIADGELVIAQIDRGILIALAGSVTADDDVIVDRELDFVVHRHGVDYRRQLADGHVVITIGRDGIVVHAANGDFACDRDRCTRIEPVDLGGGR